MNSYNYMVKYTQRGFGFICGEVWAITENKAREELEAKYYNLGIEIMSIEKVERA